MAAEAYTLYTVIALILLICALLFQIFGLSTPYWHSNNANESLSTRYGLFFACDMSSACGNHGIDEDWHQIVQILEIIGGFLIIFGVIFIFLNILLVSGLSIIYYIIAASLSVTGICILVGTIIYGVHIDKNKNQLGFSFAFSIIAGILTIVSAGFLFIGTHIRERYHHKLKQQSSRRPDSMVSEIRDDYSKKNVYSRRSSKISPYSDEKSIRDSEGFVSNNQWEPSCCCRYCYRSSNRLSVVDERYSKAEECAIVREINNTQIINNQQSYNDTRNRICSNTEEHVYNTQASNVITNSRNIETTTLTNAIINRKPVQQETPFCACVWLHGDVDFDDEQRRRILQSICTCGCCDHGDMKSLRIYKSEQKIRKTNVSNYESNKQRANCVHRNAKASNKTKQTTKENESDVTQSCKETKPLKSETGIPNVYKSESNPLTSDSDIPEETPLKPSSWSRSMNDSPVSQNLDTQKVESVPQNQRTRTKRRSSSNDVSVRKTDKVHGKSVLKKESGSNSLDSYIYDDVNTQNSFLDTPIQEYPPEKSKENDYAKQKIKGRSFRYSRHSENQNGVTSTSSEPNIFQHRKAVVHTPKIMQSDDDVVYLEEQSFDDPSPTTVTHPEAQAMDKTPRNVDRHPNQGNAKKTVKPKPHERKLTKSKSVKWEPQKPWRTIF